MPVSHLFWRTSANDCTYTTHCLLTVLLYIQHLPHHHCYDSEAVDRKCSIKKGVLRNFAKFSGKYLCQSLFFHKITGLRPATLLKKTLAQVFSCDFCKISKNTFYYRTPLMATSDYVNISDVCFLVQIEKTSKNLNLVSHFHWSHFHRCYFLFQCLFCLSQFCFILSCRCS